jgi:chemotaxis protein CheX
MDGEHLVETCQRENLTQGRRYDIAERQAAGMFIDFLELLHQGTQAGRIQTCNTGKIDQQLGHGGGRDQEVVGEVPPYLIDVRHLRIIVSEGDDMDAMVGEMEDWANGHVPYRHAVGEVKRGQTVFSAPHQNIHQLRWMCNLFVRGIIEGCMVPCRTMRKTIDVNLLNPFLDATLNCLIQMAGLAPQRQRIYLKTNPQMHGFITGIIGLSNGLTGSCMLSFPKRLAQEIVGKLLDSDPSAIDDAMISDGIGELANMVAGSAKRQFISQHQHFDISTPTVVMGEGACLYNPADTLSIACEYLPFSDAKETFLLEVALKPTVV